MTSERKHLSQRRPYHRQSFNLDNTGDAVQNGYGNLNIGRRHNNIQKGITQNGIGNTNIQRDTFNWRRGKQNTADVQENVQQNGIGKTNDKSLRRENVTIKSFIKNESYMKPGHQKSNIMKPGKLSRRDGKQNQEALSTNEILKKTTQVVQEQVNSITSMLCKSMPFMCNTNDRPTRRVMNKITQDTVTQIGNRNINSQMSVIQNASPSRYNRRCPSIIDEYDEAIFLPNYQIVLK